LPELKDICYSLGPGCYKFKDNAVEGLFVMVRDAEGVTTGGTLTLTYFTTTGTFTKEQTVNITYPNENTVRLTFEGAGESWAYVEAWQEYRIENGKLILEICSSFWKLSSCDR